MPVGGPRGSRRRGRWRYFCGRVVCEECELISGMQLRAIGWWTLALTGLSACLYSMAVDPLSQWDFNVYYSAAHAFAAGGNPYTPVHPHPGLNGDVIFQYPPLTLYLFRWMTFFSLATSKLIWLGAKLGAVALLAWVWRRDFEATDFQWPILLFIALGLNTSLLRDFVCGNIATFEQVGLWFGFGLAVRQRPYAAAAVLACVAQFKLMPVVFLALLPLMRPRDGWKPFLVGGSIFSGLLILNLLWSPGLTGNYLGLFSNANLRMDDRGANNPSSLAWFRDLIDLTSYAPGLPYNRLSGTIAYGVFLVALSLIMIRAGWNLRASLRRADPRLLVYLGCALFTVAAPRMKDYSYMLMLLPTLFVVRDLNRRAVRTDYLLLAVGLMIVAQPQQSNVPGVTDLVYMLQSYLPLYLAGGVLVYVLGALRDPDTDLVVDKVAS